MTKSLSDMAKAIGEEERAHEELRSVAEDKQRRDEEYENAMRTAFEAWKPQLGALANAALQGIRDVLMQHGVTAVLHTFPTSADDFLMARDEFGQQIINWLCWVDVVQSITAKNRHKAAPGVLAQKRLITRIGIVVPEGVWRALPLVRVRQSGYGKYGSPLFFQDPLPTVEDLRKLMDAMLIKALEE